MTEMKSKLHEALAAMWAAYDGDENAPAFVARQAEYRALADAAEAANPGAHCANIDPALWNFFSDFYKDYYGFRPRGEYSAGEVREAADKLSELIKKFGWPN